jgi:hypothetical protein
MVGSGDAAAQRAAGLAGAQVGTNALSQQLTAAQDLGGSTAATALAGAGNSYLGQQTSGTANTAQDVSNLASSLNLSSLLNNSTATTNESQSGTSAASSQQAGIGTNPNETSQPSGGGGCVLCTAALELGFFNHRRLLRRVIAHKLQKDWSNFRNAARGYFFMFTPLARWLLGHRRLAAILWPLAKMVVYEELRVSGRKLPLKRKAWLVHWTSHYACALVGKLPVPGKVTDPVIRSIAEREGVWFNVPTT